VHYEALAGVLEALGGEHLALPPRLAERVEVEARYEAYIEKELARVERIRHLEERPIPDGIDYAALAGLRNEAKEKLARFRPATLGQASRIAGVTPGDVAVLMVHLERGAASVEERPTAFAR